MKISDREETMKHRIVEGINQLFLQPDELETGLMRVPAAPDQEDGQYNLVLGACQYPAGLLDGYPAYAAWRRLAERIDKDEVEYQGLILAGDQIYADVTAGLFDPTQLDDGYRRAYERWLHQPAVQRMTARMPLIPILDDHEIRDNWEPPAGDFDPGLTDSAAERLQLARAQYLKYQRGSGPFPEATICDLAEKPLWCSLEKYGLPVFLSDTRTERDNRNVGNIHLARIMHDDQFEALLKWLCDPALADLPKIIVSPSILLPRHTRVASRHREADESEETPVTHALHSDSWDGFPHSLHSLLGFIAEHEVRYVLFLSGDEHLGCVARAELGRQDGTGPATVIHSIHTSSLYAPYPFANARSSDLAARETFSFSSNQGTGGNRQRYSCQVASEFYPGDGFTLLKLSRVSDGWQLDCEFERGEGGSTQTYRALL